MILIMTHLFINNNDDDDDDDGNDDDDNTCLSNLHVP